MSSLGDGVDTEYGAAKVAKAHFKDKDIHIYEVKVVEADDPTKINYLETFKNIARAVNALMDVKEGTICVDTISDVYTWLNAWVEDTAVQRTSIGTPQRLEWARRNILYRNLMFRLLSLPVNVIVTAQPQKVYDAKGRETSLTEPRWLQPQPHWCDIVLKFSKERVGTKIKYLCTIEKCRFRRAYNKTVEDMTFDKLVKVLKEDLGVVLE